MAKILISSLGAGFFPENSSAKREYRKAKYKIDNQEYSQSFIASVLYEHLKLDGIIFLGTVKSMWEEVYYSFCKEKNLELDEDYYLMLGETIKNLDYTSPLNVLDLSRLELALGDRSQCILIKYGITESELQENLDKIMQIVNYLEDGDELYIDITHSFRSLSLFLFLVLTFLNDLTSERNIKIKGIYYGMLDIIRELKYAPIVNLQSLFDLTQWIKGAYSLKEFGNGYLIAQLLDRQDESELARDIRNLSDAININYLPTIQQRANKLRQTLKKQESSPFKYLKNILDKFVSQFSDKTNTSTKESDFQLKLAKWYFKNKRYATGYITLEEAILTYLCEIYNKNFTNKDERDEMKDWLHENNSSSLSQLYFKINPVRKAIAHASFDKKRTSYSTAIQNANQYIQEAQKIFKTETLG
ncbi:MAG: TIGR02221 family CRISPR-associated protein [Spirulina sp.]